MCEVGTGRIHLCIAIISGVGEPACVCSSGIESVRCQPFTDAEKTVGESLISSRPYSAGSRSVKAGPVADAETVLGQWQTQRRCWASGRCRDGAGPVADAETVLGQWQTQRRCWASGRRRDGAGPVADAETVLGQWQMQRRCWASGRCRDGAGPVADAETVLGESMMCWGLAEEAEPRAVGERPVSVPSGQPVAASSTETAPSTETTPSTETAPSIETAPCTETDPPMKPPPPLKPPPRSCVFWHRSVSQAQMAAVAERRCARSVTAHTAQPLPPHVSGYVPRSVRALTASNRNVSLNKKPTRVQSVWQRCQGLGSTRKHRGEKPYGCEECGVKSVGVKSVV